MSIKTDNTLNDLLTESSIDAMIAIGTDNTVMAWNKAATMLYGWKRDEALGKALSELLPSTNEDEDFLKAIDYAKNGIQSFLPASKPFIHRLHVEIHVIPLKKQGETMGVMLLVHDVSHRILKEEELQYLNNELQNRLRQLKLTTRELAHLTHIATYNIKEPIRHFYTTIEWLIKTEAASMSNGGKATFRRMQSSLNRMNLLLDDVITLTQINVVEKPDTLINLEEMVSDVIKSLEPKILETRTAITTGELCDIRAHKNQVFLLLQHVISNAIRFNASKAPYVNISCRKVSFDGNNVKDRTGEFYQLSITHNGNGFENIDSNTIFDTFDKSHESSYMGSGIAAVIAAKIMEAHSGFITVEKDTNGDMKIKCYFPV